MNFTYENQGSGTFLVYELKSDEELDTMCLGMLTNNTIPGLTPLHFTQMNNSRYIKYNVSSKISVSQFFSGAINKKQLLGLFKGIADAMVSAEEYMINPNSIVIDTNYIFANVSSCDTELICLPIKGIYSGTDLKEFFRNIMFNTKFDQTENCDYVAKIMNFLNSSNLFSIYDFKNLIGRIIDESKTPSAVSIQQSVPQVQPTPVNPQFNPQINPVQNVQPVVNQNRINAPAAPNNNAANYASKNVKPANAPQMPMPSNAQKMAVPSNAPQMAVPGTAPKMAVPGTAPKMAVPGMTPQAAASNSAPSVSQEVNDEDKISLMYLLQHYNKENAEKYKQQKNAKKGKKSAGNMEVPNAAVNGNVPKINNPVQQNNFSVPQNNIPAPQNNFVQPQQNFRQASIPAPEIKQPVPVGNYVSPIPQSSANNSANFGETVFIQNSENSDTVFLGAMDENEKIHPYLISERNNEKIPLNKQVFRIGRDQTFNDYVVQNNKFVGHSHCHIIVENGEYFIIDDNSKNRTFVDNNPIRPGEKIKLSHGQHIKLADEGFEFRLF